MARTRQASRARGRARKHPPIAPVRMPGLNFDTFEQEGERREGAYGTDRAPTYQSRYAAEYPRRYVRRFLNWLRGRPARERTRRRMPVRRARSMKRGRARRAMH